MLTILQSICVRVQTTYIIMNSYNMGIIRYHWVDEFITIPYIPWFVSSLFSRTVPTTWGSLVPWPCQRMPSSHPRPSKPTRHQAVVTTTDGNSKGFFVESYRWHQKEEVKLHLIWMYCSWNLENEVVWTIVIQRDGSKQKTLQMASLVVKDTIDTSCLNKPSDGIETELKVPYFDLETWISLK